MYGRLTTSTHLDGIAFDGVLTKSNHAFFRPEKNLSTATSEAGIARTISFSNCHLRILNVVGPSPVEEPVSLVHASSMCYLRTIETENKNPTRL